MSLSRRMKKAAFRANMKAAANKNSVNNTHINEETELGQEDSFLANMLGMISHSPFMKKVLLNAVGLTLMATAPGFAGDIQSLGNTVVDLSGTTYRITTGDTQVRGETALNAFSKFQLAQGEIANIYYNGGADVKNIINFVGPKININGIVNTIKTTAHGGTGYNIAEDRTNHANAIYYGTNQVGGNLYFLSSNGMVLGSAGVVNTGSFYAIVPNAAFMQNFLTGDLSNPTGVTSGVSGFYDSPSSAFLTQINNITGGLINGYNNDNGITLNPQGSIQIQGKINANKIGLYARNTTGYGISITGADEYDKATLQTVKRSDFADIVNTANSSSIYSVDTAAFNVDDGNITIVALGKGDAVTGINSSNAEIKTAGQGSVTILSEGKANLSAIKGRGVNIEANQGIELNGITAYDNNSILVRNTGDSDAMLNKNGGAAGDIIVKGAINTSNIADIVIRNDAAASDGNGSIQLGKVTGNKFEKATFNGQSVTLMAKNNITDTSHASYPDTPNIIAANSQINITATNGNVSLTNMSYSSNGAQHADLNINAGGSATLKNLVGRRVSVTAKKGIDVNRVISNVESNDTGNAINIVNEGAGATGDIVLKGSLEVSVNNDGTHNINVENKATASDGNGNIYLGELSEDDLVYASLSGKNITIKATNAIVDRDHGQTVTQNKIKSTDVGSGDWNGISLTATNGDLSITNTQFLKSDVEGETYAKLALATGGKATLNDLVGKTVSVTAKKGIEVNNVQSTRLEDGDVNEISLKNTGSGATGNILLKGTITADGYDNTNVIAGAGDILIQNDATANGDNGNIQIGEEGIDDLVKAELIGKNVTLTASNAIADTQNATTPTTKNLIKSNTNISLTATKSTATITNTEFDTTDTVEETKNYANLTVNTGDKATVKNLVGRNVTVNAKAGADIDGVTAKGYKQIVSETVTDVEDGTIAITNIEDSTGNIVLKGDIIANGKNGTNNATVLSEGNGVITVENKAAVTENNENGNIQIGEVVGTNLNAARIVGEQITLKASDGIADTKHASKTTKNYIKSSDNEVGDGHGIKLTTTEGDINITNTVFGKKEDNEDLSSAQLVVDAKGGKTTLKDLVGINVDVKAKAGIDIDGVTATGRVYETVAQKGTINIVNIANSTGDIVLKGTITAKGVVDNALVDGKGDITVENKATASDGNGNVVMGEDGASDLNPVLISGKTISIKASNNIVDAKHSSGTTKNVIQSAQIEESAGTVLFEATSGDIRVQNTQFGADVDPVYAEITVDAKGGKAILDNFVGKKVTITAKKGVEVNGITSTEADNDETTYEIKILNTNSATGDIIVKGAISADGMDNTTPVPGMGDILIQNDAAASDGNGNIQIGKVEDTELVEAEITAKNITMVAKNGVLDKATESSTNKNLIQSAGKVNITANASDVQIQNTQFGADVDPVYAEITVAAVNGKTILDNLVGRTVTITAKKGVEVNGIISTEADNNDPETTYEIKILNTNSATGDIVLKGVISANGMDNLTPVTGIGDILIQNDSTVSTEGNIQIGKVENSELLNAEITGRNVYMAAQNGILDAASEASTNKNAINTDGTVVMEAKTGTITLGNTKVNAEKVNVEGNLEIVADKKAIEIANLEVNSNLAVIAPVESVTVNNVIAKGDLIVDSHTTASLTDVTANTADVVANKGIVLDGVKTTGIIVPDPLNPEENPVELKVKNTGQYASGDIIIKGTISANDESGVETVYGAGDILIQNDAEINKEELGQHGNIYIGTKEDQVTNTATINGENVKLQAKDKITDAGDFDSNKLNAINSKGTVEMIAGTLVTAATEETPATYKNGEIELDNTKFGTTDAQVEPTEFGDFALTAGEKVTLNNLTDLTEDVYVEKLNGIVGTTNSKQAIVKSLTLNTTSKEATVNNVKTTGDLIVNSGKDALLDTVTAKTATITSAKGAKLHDVTTTGLKDVVPPAEIAYELSVHNTETGNIELTGNISANNQAAALPADPKYGDIFVQNVAEGTTETNGNVLIGVEGESMTPVAITGADIVLKANNTVVDAGDKDSENKNTIKSKGTVEFVAGKVVVGPEPSIEGGNITIDNTEVDTTDAGENPEYGEFVLEAGEGVTLTDVTQKVDELAVIAKTATIDKVKVKGGEGHVSVIAGETATLTNVEADGAVAVYAKDGDITISDLTSKASKVYDYNGPMVDGGEITIGLGVNAGGKATLTNTTSKFAYVMTKKGAELNNVTTTGLVENLEDLSEIAHAPEAEITIINTSLPVNPGDPDEATGNIVLKGVITANNGENVGKGDIYIKNAALAGEAGSEDAENGNIVLGKETKGDEPEFTPVTIEGKNIVLDASNNLTDIGKATGIEKDNAIKSAEGEITMLTAGGSVVLDNTTLNNPTSDLVVNANKIEAIDDITAKSVNSVTKNGAVFNNVKTVTVDDTPGVKEISIVNNLPDATGNIVLKGVITADNGENVGKGDIYIRNYAPAGEAGVEDAENGNIVLGAVTGEEPVFENVTINGKTVDIYAANSVIDENEVEEETVTKNVINSEGAVDISAGGDINLDNTDFDTTDVSENPTYGNFELTADNNVKLSNAVANVNTLVVTANKNAELADVEASGDLSVTATNEKASLDNVTAKTAFVVAKTGIELKDVTTTGVNIPDATPIDVPSNVAPFMVDAGNYAIAAVNGVEGNIVLKGKIEAKNDGYDPGVPGSKEYSNIIVENLALAHPVVEPAVTDYENGNIILHGEEVAGEGENPATYNPVTISGENIIMYAKNDVADVVMSGDEVVENSEYKNVIKSKAKYVPGAVAPTHVYVEAGQDLILSNTDFDTTDTHQLDPENANDAIAYGDFELAAYRDASLSNNVSKADNVAVSAFTHDANLTDVDVTGDLTVFADHKADLDTINANTVAVQTYVPAMSADDEAGVYINNLTSDGLKVLDMNDSNVVDEGDATIGLGVMTAGKAVLTNTTSKIATVMANNGVELSNVTTTGLISDLEDATPEKTYAPEAEIFVLNQANGNIVLKDSVAANKVTPATAETEETTVVGAGNIVLMNQAMASEESGNIVLGEFVEGNPLAEPPVDDVLNPVTVDGNIIDMMASANITDAGNGESEESNAINAKTSVGMQAQQSDVTLDNTVITVKNETEEGTVYGELAVVATNDVTLTKSTEAGVTAIAAGNDATISNLTSKATLLTPNAENPTDETGLEVTAGGKATLTDVTAMLAKIESDKGTTATRLTTTAVSEVVDSIKITNNDSGNIVLIDSVAANNVIPATAETEETTVVGAGDITITNDGGNIVLGEFVEGDPEIPTEDVVNPVTVDGNNITMTASDNITDAGEYVAPEAEQEQEAVSTVNAINAKGNVALTATDGKVEFDNTDLTAKNDTDAENVTYGDLDVIAGTDVTMTKSTEAGVTRITADDNVTLNNLTSKATLLTPNAEEPTNEIGLEVTAGKAATLTDVTAKLAKIQSVNGTTATRLTTTAVSEVEDVDSINITNNVSGNIVLIDSVAANNVIPATAETEETTVVGAGNITITNDGGDIVLGEFVEGNPLAEPPVDDVLNPVTVDGNNITMTASANITDEEKADSEDANVINAKGNVALTATNGKVEFDNTVLTAKDDTNAENVTYGNLNVTAGTDVTMTKSTEAGVTVINAVNDVTINNLTSKATLLTPNADEPTDEKGLEVTAGNTATLTDVTAKLAKIQSVNGTTVTRLTTTAVSAVEGVDSINIANNDSGNIVLIDSVAANNVIPATAETEETTVVGAGSIAIQNNSGDIVIGQLEDEVLTPVIVDGNNITMTASANITDAGNDESAESNAINAKGNVALTATAGNVEFDNTVLTAKDETDAENVTYGNLDVTAGTDVTMTKSTEAGVTVINAVNDVTLNNLTSKATLLTPNAEEPTNEKGLEVTAGKTATLTDVTAKLAKIQSVNGTTATRLTTTAVSEVEGVDSSINILNTGAGNITLIDSVAANNVIPATAETEETTVVGAGSIAIQNNSGDIVIGQLEDEVLTPVTVDGNNITMTASANITDAGNDESAESNAINAKGNVVLAATGEVELDNTVLTAKDETDAENVTYGNLNVTAGTDVTMTKSTEAGVTIIEAGNDVTISNLISKATLLTPNAEEPTDEIGLNVTADGKAELTDVTAKLAMIESGEGATVTRLTTTAVSEVEDVASIHIYNTDEGDITLIDNVTANNEAYDPAAENPAPQYGNITITNDGDGLVLGEFVEGDPELQTEDVLNPVTVNGNNISMEVSGDITDAGDGDSEEANAINASGDVVVVSDSDVTLDNTTTVAVGNVGVGALDVEIDDVTADTVFVFAGGDATVSNVTSEGSRLEEEAFDYNGDEIDDDITIGMAVVAGGKATVSDTTSKFAAIMAAGGAELNNVVTTGVKGEEDALPEYNEKTYEFAVLNRGEEANDVLVKGEINANEGNLLIANESGKVVIGEAIPAIEEDPAVFNAAAISGANVAIIASTNVEDANDDEASNSIVAGESLEIAAAEDVVLNNTVINSPNAVLTMTANTITDAKSITASKAAITAHDGIALADVTTSAADENDPEVTFELDIQNVAAGEEDPATGNIVVTGKLNAGTGDIRILNNAEADEENGNVTLEDVEGNNVGIAAEGDVDANDITATEGDVDVIATNVEVNDVTAGTDVTMVAEGDMNANDVAAGNDAVLSSTGDLTANDVSSEEGNVSLAAGDPEDEESSSSINVGNVEAGTDVAMNSTGDLTANNVAAEGNVSAEADNITAGNVSAGTDVAMTTEGNLTANDVSSEEGNVSLAAGDPEDEESSSSINVGNVEAGENVAMNSTGDLTAKDVEAEGNVSAEADNITAGNVSAGTDVAMTTEGNLATNDITATEGEVEVSATNVEVNNVTAGTDATIAAQGEVNVKGEVNAENVNIESNLAGDVNIDSATANSNLDVTVNDGDLNAGTLQGDNINVNLNSEEGVADVDTYAVGSSLDSSAANTSIGKIEQLDPNSPIDVKFSGVNGSDEYNAEVKNIIYNPGADMEGEVAYKDKEGNVQVLGPDGIIDVYNKVPEFDQAAREIYMLRPGMEMENTASKVDYKDANKFVLLFTRIKEYIRNSVVAITSGLLAKQEDNSNKQQSQEHKKLNLMDAYGAHEKFVENEGVELIERDFGDSSEGEEVAKHSISLNSNGEPIIR